MNEYVGWNEWMGAEAGAAPVAGPAPAAAPVTSAAPASMVHPAVSAQTQAVSALQQAQSAQASAAHPAGASIPAVQDAAAAATAHALAATNAAQAAAAAPTPEHAAAAHQAASAHAAAASDHANAAYQGTKIQQVAKQAQQQPAMKQLVADAPAYKELFKQQPEVATMFGNHPEVFDLLRQHPEYADHFRTDPDFLRSVFPDWPEWQEPAFAEGWWQHPEWGWADYYAPPPAQAAFGGGGGVAAGLGLQVQCLVPSQDGGCLKVAFLSPEGYQFFHITRAGKAYGVRLAPQEVSNNRAMIAAGVPEFVALAQKLGLVGAQQIATSGEAELVRTGYGHFGGLGRFGGRGFGSGWGGGWGGERRHHDWWRQQQEQQALEQQEQELDVPGGGDLGTTFGVPTYTAPTATTPYAAQQAQQAAASYVAEMHGQRGGAPVGQYGTSGEFSGCVGCGDARTGWEYPFTDPCGVFDLGMRASWDGRFFYYPSERCMEERQW